MKGLAKEKTKTLHQLSCYLQQTLLSSPVLIGLMSVGI